MSCALLIAFLATTDPAQVTEDEIRIAIDLASAEMEPGEGIQIEQTQDATRRGLLNLLNANKRLRAVCLNNVITVQRMK